MVWDNFKKETYSCIMGFSCWVIPHISLVLYVYKGLCVLGFFCLFFKDRSVGKQGRCRVIHFIDENWGPEELFAQCCVPVKQWSKRWPGSSPLWWTQKVVLPPRAALLAGASHLSVETIENLHSCRREAEQCVLWKSFCTHWPFSFQLW